MSIMVRILTNNHLCPILNLSKNHKEGNIMTSSDRQEEVLNLILTQKCTNVKELCAAVYASPATIRRDLRVLENKGFVRLQYGNIIPLAEVPKELSLELRQNQAKESKRIIARYSASLITPNANVILDSSSSALLMADYIPVDAGITVFTNCIKAAVRLCERNITVYLIGGKIDNKNFCADGAWTEEAVQSLHVDFFFFSSKAMDADGNISGQSEPGVHIRRQMLAHSTKQYFLCNSEKVGKKSTFLLCNAAQLTGLITEKEIPEIPGVNVLIVPGK